jgi:thiol:disulfide interchange protein DsbC
MMIMKSFFLVIGLLIFTIQPCFSDEQGQCRGIDTAAISNIGRETLGGALSGASIVSKKPIDDLGLCEVIVRMRGGRYLPCYISGNSMILGHLYRDGQNITQDGIAEIRKSSFLGNRSELDKIVAFTYRPRVKKTSLYMITDPLCPYCHKVESQIRDLADKYNAQINVILYSVHGSHGAKKCVEAVCRNFTLDDYLNEDWKTGNADSYQCERGGELIEKTRRIISEIGIEGVPMFIDGNGLSVSGANLPALKELISQGKGE